MPLIECPECGREISGQARACPYCGHVNMPSKGPKCIKEHWKSGWFYQDGSGCRVRLQIKNGSEQMAAETTTTESEPGTRHLSPLDRRLVEIELTEIFTAALGERYGPEAALEILRDVVGRAAARSAAEIRRLHPEPTLTDLWAVWQNLGGEGRLDLELLELNSRTLRFLVRRCAYAEAYQAMNLTNLGLEFSCRRDAPFAQALLPGVKMRQSPTIMEGHDSCLFEYLLTD